MKKDDLHVPYDSPIEISFADEIIGNMSKALAEHIDEQTFHAICHAGFYIDREKMVAALKQDKRRYEEAYSRGYSKGREDRDNQIIRCKDCVLNPKLNAYSPCPCNCSDSYYSWIPKDDWYCADAERREDEDE